jgi:hypothetical protein
MGRDTGIADRLRAKGLKVVEVSGWRERGSATFSPQGSIDHHTAGPLSGNAPSLNICINGRSDLPGPLCHVLIARDNTCYVIAAGRANHAGTGGYGGLSGNSSVYGVEHENTGTGNEPWREDQRDTAARVHAALLSGIGRDSSWVCQHKEWTTRKIDKWGQTGSDMRNRVNKYLSAAPTPVPTDPEEDDDMQPYFFVQKPGDAAVWLVPADQSHKRHIPSQWALEIHQAFLALANPTWNRNIVPIADEKWLAWFNSLPPVYQRIEDWGTWIDGRAEQNEAAILAAIKAIPASSGVSITDADAAKIAKAVVAEIAS